MYIPNSRLKIFDKEVGVQSQLNIVLNRSIKYNSKYNQWREFSERDAKYLEKNWGIIHKDNYYLLNSLYAFLRLSGVHPERDILFNSLDKYVVLKEEFEDIPNLKINHSDYKTYKGVKYYRVKYPKSSIAIDDPFDRTRRNKQYASPFLDDNFYLSDKVISNDIVYIIYHKEKENIYSIRPIPGVPGVGIGIESWLCRNLNDVKRQLTAKYKDIEQWDNFRNSEYIDMVDTLNKMKSGEIDITKSVKKQSKKPNSNKQSKTMNYKSKYPGGKRSSGGMSKYL